jgi:hypothetical protein
VQTHFRFDLFKGLGQEMGAAHPRLEGSERMLNGLSTHDHGLRHAVEPSLHPVEHRFVPSDWPSEKSWTAWQTFLIAQSVVIIDFLALALTAN